MQHQMKLNAGPFESIRSGRKRFEIRLHDEKRRQIAVGDTITFTRLPDGAESVQVEVVGLRRYETFEELYSAIAPGEIDCEGWTMDQLLSSTYEIYTREQEQEYGALAIEVRLLA